MSIKRSRSRITQGSTFKVRDEDDDMMAKGGDVHSKRLDENSRVTGVHKTGSRQEGQSRMGMLNEIKESPFIGGADRDQITKMKKKTIGENIEISRGHRPLKGLAQGGEILKEKYPEAGGTASFPTSRIDAGYGKVIMRAEGGEIEDEMHPESIADAIMEQERKTMASREMHEGDEDLKEGEVDLDDNGREIPNQFYHANEHEALEQNLDHDIMEMDQPEDSNLHGDPREAKTEDEHDRAIIAAIRAKRRQIR
jgi:hypothetical protein